jgi:glycosyltransferase involved in cell wall biosynthesis
MLNWLGGGWERDVSALGALLVIVPAYNEEASLKGVLESLPTHASGLPVQVVVIDDGSSDGTAAIARAHKTPVLEMPFNVGIGVAVQAGFKYARDRDFPYAIQFDGDGQHRADQIDALIAPILSGEHDVVIGSRFLDKGSFRSSWARRIGIRLLRFMNSYLTGATITDSTSGFRAYNARAIKFLAGNYPHDYPEPEAVVLLHRHGFKVLEIPAQMEPRQGGRSSITPLRALYYITKVSLAMLIEATRRPVAS